MSRLLTFEDFASPPVVETRPPTQPGAEPDTPPRGGAAAPVPRSYDDGYRAGWDDALAQDETRRQAISAEFERNLQELAFSFHEARTQVMLSLRPLVEGLVAQLFPRLGPMGLADQVVAVLEPIAEQMSAPTISLVCSVEDAPFLRPLLEGTTGLGATLDPDPTVLPGQVSFRLGHERHAITLDAAMTRITELVSAHFAACAADPLETPRHAV